MQLLSIILLSVLILLLVVFLFVIYSSLKKQVHNQHNQLVNQNTILDGIVGEIKQTKIELKRNNDEAEYNRLVPVVYSQLKRFEDAINQFEFEALKGNDAFYYLLSKINLKQTELFDKHRYPSEDVFKALTTYEAKNLIAIESLAILASEGAKNIVALYTVLSKSKCSEEQIESLHQLFIDNISTRYFAFVTKVLEVARKRIKDIPEEQKGLLFQKEQFIKDRELIKNFKLIIDFKKKPITSF